MPARSSTLGTTPVILNPVRDKSQRPQEAGLLNQIHVLAQQECWTTVLLHDTYSDTHNLSVTL
jgi:hypothetical protein